MTKQLGYTNLYGHVISALVGCSYTVHKHGTCPKANQLLQIWDPGMRTRTQERYTQEKCTFQVCEDLIGIKQPPPPRSRIGMKLSCNSPRPLSLPLPSRQVSPHPLSLPLPSRQVSPRPLSLPLPSRRVSPRPLSLPLPSRQVSPTYASL